MTRPRVGIGIVSGGNRLAGTDGGREGKGPPAGKIRSRISSSLSLSLSLSRLRMRRYFHSRQNL